MSASSVLKSMFPFISAAASLGGPLGTMAANAVGSALGVNNVPSTPEGIESAISNVKDPVALAALQKAEQDFQVQMTQLGYKNVEDILSIDSADRANARAREIAIKDKLPAILAITVTGGFFGLLYIMIFRAVPVSSATILNVMVGSLGAAWLGVINYYFGSSSGSAKKTEIMAQQASAK